MRVAQKVGFFRARMNDLDGGIHSQTKHFCFSGFPRIVNYETGKAGAKARSLWRLEPLRIRLEIIPSCLSPSSMFL